VTRLEPADRRRTVEAVQGSVTSWPPKSPHAFDQHAAVFTDAVGSTDALISNEGARLHLKVLGSAFAGEFLDDFAPIGQGPTSARFRLQHGLLCDYTLDFKLPMTLTEGSNALSTAVGVRVGLGSPAERGALTEEWVQLCLSADGGAYTTGRHDLVETALIELGERLPGRGRLRCCFGCDFSDYSPYGNGVFGTLYCFRTAKREYRRVVDKDALFDLWDKTAGAVQETWLCEEWEPRIAGRGYRG
jgi:hypothetical protein